MIELDSPNIFWERYKEPEPDKIAQTTFHNGPLYLNKDNNKIHFKYSTNKRLINHWFNDPSILYRMDGWWLDI
jgi:hypothetical protein